MTSLCPLPPRTGPTEWRRDSFSSIPEVWALQLDPERPTRLSVEEELGIDPPGPATKTALLEGPVPLADHPAAPAPAGESLCLTKPKARLTFEGPARFPLPEFGVGPCPGEYEDDVAVIHEGMRLIANERGDYQVRFNISMPAMPATLRLQLTVATDPPPGRPIVLSLPPIPIEPEGISPEFYEPATYGVIVRGHSEPIRRQYDRVLAATLRTDAAGDPPPILRAGTARFGVPRLSSVDPDR